MLSNLPAMPFAYPSIWSIRPFTSVVIFISNSLFAVPPSALSCRVTWPYICSMATRMALMYSWSTCCWAMSALTLSSRVMSGPSSTRRCIACMSGRAAGDGGRPRRGRPSEDGERRGVMLRLTCRLADELLTFFLAGPGGLTEGVVMPSSVSVKNSASSVVGAGVAAAAAAMVPGPRWDAEAVGSIGSAAMFNP